MEVWSCVRDEGGPLGVGDQEPASNRRELRSSRAMVVSVVLVAAVSPPGTASEELSPALPAGAWPFKEDSLRKRREF
jgi:hypothetical protein